MPSGHSSVVERLVANEIYKKHLFANSLGLTAPIDYQDYPISSSEV